MLFAKVGIKPCRGQTKIDLKILLNSLPIMLRIRIFMASNKELNGIIIGNQYISVSCFG